MGNTAATPERGSENVAASNQDPARSMSAININNITHGYGRKPSWLSVARIIYVILCVATIIVSIAAIAVTVVTAITTKAFTDDETERLGAMIVLAVTSAIALSITIYAMVAVLRKRCQSIHVASIVLLLLAIIQAIIAGVALKLTVDDEVAVRRALAESFSLARQQNPKYVKTWSSIQYNFKCCGLSTVEDYRHPQLPRHLAPEVPISCCALYKPNQSEILQERHRQGCRVRKEYYQKGCDSVVLDVFRSTTQMVLGFIIALIILMVIVSIIGFILSRLKNSRPRADIEIQNVVTNKPKV